MIISELIRVERLLISCVVVIPRSSRVYVSLCCPFLEYLGNQYLYMRLMYKILISLKSSWVTRFFSLDKRRGFSFADVNAGPDVLPSGRMELNQVHTMMLILRKQCPDSLEPFGSKGWSTCIPFARRSILWGCISLTSCRASVMFCLGCVHTQCFRTLGDVIESASFQNRSRMELAHALH